MPLLKIIFLSIVLFVLRQAVAAAAVLLLGGQNTNTHIIGGVVGGAVVSVLVFAWISYTYPSKALLYTLVVGVSAYILGIFATALAAGTLLWDPILLVFDVPAFLIAMLAGVTLGRRFFRRVAVP